MLNRGKGIRILLALGIALFAFISYCNKSSVNPITGEKQHVSLTPEQEIAVGLHAAPEMAAQFGGLYNDEVVQQKVKAVGQKIVQQTEAAKSVYQFDFHVLADDQIVNAFALPGGQIFITMALLNRLQSEDQLAGVLGHEIGHVIGRHSAEQMAKTELTQGLVGATQIALEDGTNRSGAIAAYVGNIINLKYGRSDELESDQFGVKYMYASGYNPEAMIEVMEILEKASGGSNTPEYMNSHPSPANRIEEIKRHIAELKGEYMIGD